MVRRWCCPSGFNWRWKRPTRGEARKEPGRARRRQRSIQVQLRPRWTAASLAGSATPNAGAAPGCVMRSANPSRGITAQARRRAGALARVIRRSIGSSRFQRCSSARMAGRARVASTPSSGNPLANAALGSYLGFIRGSGVYASQGADIESLPVVRAARGNWRGPAAASGDRAVGAWRRSRQRGSATAPVSSLLRGYVARLRKP